MVREMKASQRRTLQREFNKWVVDRVGRRCEAAGQGKLIDGSMFPCGGVMQCSHVMTQGSVPSLKLHPWNATSMCYRHHKIWWENPGESGLWIRKYIGSRYQDLEHLKYNRFTLKKLTMDEIRAWWLQVPGWW